MGVAGYVRISEDKQDQWGVKSQADDIRDYAQRHNLDLSAIYEDNDLSASKGKTRPQFDVLMARVKRGEIDTIVVAHLDRLYRSPRQLEDLIDIVEETGFRIRSVYGGEFDLATSDGRAFARVVTSFAKKESEDKGRRVARRRLSDAKQGKARPGGKRPLGYNEDGVTLDPLEAAVLRRAIDHVLDGGTLAGAQRIMRDSGLRAQNRRAYALSTVKRMLTSPRLAGHRVYKGEIVARDAWEALVTDEEHLRLVAILSDPSRARPAGVTARAHTLSGYIYCAQCDLRMYIAKHNIGNIYRCTECYGSIKEAPLEEVVRDLVLARSLDALAHAPDEDTEIESAPIRAEIAELQNRLSRANEAYLGGAFTVDELARTKTEIQTALEAAYASLTGGHRTMPGLPRDYDELRELWDDPDALDWRRDLIDTVVRRINVQRVGSGSRRPIAERLTVVWR